MLANPSRHREFGLHAALIVSLMGLAFIMLSSSGALQTGVTGNPDEAAHYVTSLMIRSYLSEGLSPTPVQFAESYYLHYPKVAFGVWPPMFHLALASWMFLTTASPASALGFIAITLVVLAYILFRTASAHLGVTLSLLIAVWFVLLPTVQRTAGLILLDVPCALLMVSATIVFGRYLDSVRWQNAVQFALLASAAMLTKNNAIALALLPPIAIGLSQKWFIFKRGSLWAIPIIVAAICVPWYIFTWDLFTFVATMAGDAWWAPLDNLVLLLREPGYVFVPLALLGMWSTVGRGPANGVWNSLFTLVLSVWLFHSVVYPISAPRYMLPAYAGLVFFCGAGLQSLANRLPLRFANAQVVVSVAALAMFLATSFHIPKKPHRGFIEAADYVLRTELDPNGTVLVCSDPIGEGSFIAALATSEASPQTIVFRASKLLAHSSWVGANYSAKHHDSESLLKAIDRARVEFIAMDEVDESPHHKMLVKALKHSSDWSMIGEVVPRQPTPDNSTVRLYRRQTPLPPGHAAFELDLRDSLGLTLKR